MTIADTSRLNPAQTSELSTQLARERTESVSRQIREDAAQRGFGDMQGLSVTLGNGQRYLIRDVYRQSERRSEIEHGWIPRFQTRVGAFGETEGRHFGRPQKRVRQRNIEIFPKGHPHVDKEGLPRIFGVKVGRFGREDSGGIVLGGRRKTALERKLQTKMTAVVEIYGSDGQLIKIKKQRRDTGSPDGKQEQGALDEIFQLAGEHGILAADWDERRVDGRDTEEVQVALPPYASRGRTSTETDEKRHPAIFDIVTAQLEERGIRQWEGLSWARVTPGSTNGSTVRQEVVRDAGVKEKTQDGFEGVRTFVIRTTHRTTDGTTVQDDIMTEPDFRAFLETGSQKSRIEDMRLVRDKPETAGYDSPYQLNFDEALAMLSYPDVYQRSPEHTTSAERSEAFRTHMDVLRNDDEERKYAEEILASIEDVGFERFHEVVGDMHQAFETSAKALRIDRSWDASDSFVVRELMRERLARPSADFFGDSVDAEKARTAIIDGLIGRRFEEVNLSVGDLQPTPTGKMLPKENGKGVEPEVEMKRKVEFNLSWFTSRSVVDGELKKTKKKFDKVWNPVKKQALLIYEHYTEQVNGGDEVPAAEYEKLGRMLRRTIAQ